MVKKNEESEVDAVDEAKIQVLNFFEKYYYESLNQKSQFISNLKFFFTIAVASFGYIAWIANEWKTLTIFNPLSIVSVICILLLFCLVGLNIYSFWLSCCIFNPKEYKELPEATSMSNAINKKTNSNKLEYMIKEYHECTTHNSKLNDKRKLLISRLIQIFIINAILILITFIPTLIAKMW